MVYFCYGFIGYKRGAFCDRQFAKTVAMKGRRIIKKAIELVNTIQPAAGIVLVDTDGFIVNIERKNFNSSFIQEAKRITEELNKLLGFKYIKLKFEGFFTEGNFYNLQTYDLYNKYSGQHIRIPNTRPIFFN